MRNQHTLFILAAMIIGFSVAANIDRSKTLRGDVTDGTTGDAIENVQVKVVSTGEFTQTDYNGKFEILAPTSDELIELSKTGYVTRQIKTSEQADLRFKLYKEGEEPVLADTAFVAVIQDVEPVEELVMEDMAIGEAESYGAVSSGSMSRGGGRGAAKRSRRAAAYHQPLMAPSPEPAPDWNTEEYDQITELGFKTSIDDPLSTFSIDVDAASYATIRRYINDGMQPYKDMVRIEEMVNYFDYDYKDPGQEHPFSINTEVSTAPWNREHRLVHIGIQGKKVDYDELNPSNLVFLIDVSGSMSDRNKLPLLKSSLKLLLKNLSDKDRVSIVVYASASGLVLPATPASEGETIMAALDKLQAGGSTAGGASIQLAYKVAKENLIEGGNNRVILCTDGDFNVGVSSTSEMVRLIEEKRKEGIFLTIAGFGMGNYKDGRMEQISNAGNGNYYYIDNIKEAQKVFVTDMRGTLFTIAKDVKIQVEFNPNLVQAYRLIGYENRMLNKEDFNDDKKDAGELGAGHTVTALYEVIPVGVDSEFTKSVDELKYQRDARPGKQYDDELLTVKFRYKKPDGDTSILITQPLKDSETVLAKTSDNFRWSAAVAEYGLLLRDSEFKKDANYAQVIELARGARGEDPNGYRLEFINMVKSSSLLADN